MRKYWIFLPLIALLAACAADARSSESVQRPEGVFTLDELQGDLAISIDEIEYRPERNEFEHACLQKKGGEVVPCEVSQVR